LDSKFADQTFAFYRLAGVAEASIRYVDDRVAGHAFITDDQGGAWPSHLMKGCFPPSLIRLAAPPSYFEETGEQPDSHSS